MREVPRATANASRVLGSGDASSDMAPITLGGNFVTEAPIGPARGSQPGGPGWPAHPQGVRKCRWEKTGRFRTFFEGPQSHLAVLSDSTPTVGSAIVDRCKLLLNRFFCRQIKPIPAPVEPRESGCRAAAGRLIFDCDVPRFSSADLRPERIPERGASRQRRPGGRCRNRSAQFAYSLYILYALNFRFH